MCTKKGKSVYFKTIVWTLNSIVFLSNKPIRKESWELLAGHKHPLHFPPPPVLLFAPGKEGKVGIPLMSVSKIGWIFPDCRPSGVMTIWYGSLGQTLPNYHSKLFLSWSRGEVGLNQLFLLELMILSVLPWFF